MASFPPILDKLRRSVRVAPEDDVPRTGFRGGLPWRVVTAMEPIPQLMSSFATYSPQRCLLGRGSFGEVYDHCRNEQSVAVKVITMEAVPMVMVLAMLSAPPTDDERELRPDDKSVFDLECALREVELAKELGSVGVGPAMYNDSAVIVLKDSVTIVFVMEQLDTSLTNLSQWVLSRLEEPLHRRLTTMAGLGIMCADLKLNNVMVNYRGGAINPESLRVIDFGGDWCTKRRSFRDVGSRDRTTLRLFTMHLRLFLYTLWWSRKWMFVDKVRSFYRTERSLVDRLEEHLCQPRLRCLLETYHVELTPKALLYNLRVFFQQESAFDGRTLTVSGTNYTVQHTYRWLCTPRAELPNKRDGKFPG
jgi:hypothetical protein